MCVYLTFVHYKFNSFQRLGLDIDDPEDTTPRLRDGEDLYTMVAIVSHPPTLSKTDCKPGNVDSLSLVGTVYRVLSCIGNAGPRNWWSVKRKKSWSVGLPWSNGGTVNLWFLFTRRCVLQKYKKPSKDESNSTSWVTRASTYMSKTELRPQT